MTISYGVKKAHWVVRLAPQLSGKAQQAYVAMPTTEAGQYDQVKAAILRRYDINAETYWQRYFVKRPRKGKSRIMRDGTADGHETAVELPPYRSPNIGQREEADHSGGGRTAG